MADLSLTYTDLLKEVGYYLAFGETTGSYTSDQTSRADNAVEEGCRLFYYPEDVDGQPFNGWSFMNPIGTLSVVSGTGTYSMPTGVESIDGIISFAAGSGYPPIQVIDEEGIRALGWPANYTGTPAYAALRPSNSTVDSTTVQTIQLILFPTPNITATATYRYWIKPQVLASGVLYPLGTAAHASTLRAACLAAAELAENDEEGPHYKRYVRRMKVSMRIDRRNTPEYYGQMVDNSLSYLAWEGY